MDAPLSALAMLDPDFPWFVPAAGLVAGFMNVLAGGGSLLTLPGLMFAGLDPLTANATNRLAIVIQNVVGVANFHRIEPYERGPSLRRALWTVPAAIVGAALAAHAPPVLITGVLSLALVYGGLHLLRDPSARGGPADPPSAEAQSSSALWAMLGIGFYGGFVQAGAGFLFVAVLCGRLGMSTLDATREKVLAVLLYTLPALLLFAFEGLVNWRAGLLLAAGNATGAFIASSLGSRFGDRWIRRILGLALVIVAARLVLG